MPDIVDDLVNELRELARLSLLPKYAVKHEDGANQVRQVAKLIATCRDKKVLDEIGTSTQTTPLIAACAGNLDHFISMLLDLGVDPNKKNTDGITPLIALVFSQYNTKQDPSLRAVTYLIEKGANPDTTVDINKLPKHSSVTLGSKASAFTIAAQYLNSSLIFTLIRKEVTTTFHYSVYNFTVLKLIALGVRLDYLEDFFPSLDQHIPYMDLTRFNKAIFSIRDFVIEHILINLEIKNLFTFSSELYNKISVATMDVNLLNDLQKFIAQHEKFMAKYINNDFLLKRIKLLNSSQFFLEAIHSLIYSHTQISFDLFINKIYKPTSPQAVDSGTILALNKIYWFYAQIMEQLNKVNDPNYTSVMRLCENPFFYDDKSIYVAIEKDHDDRLKRIEEELPKKMAWQQAHPIIVELSIPVEKRTKDIASVIRENISKINNTDCNGETPLAVAIRLGIANDVKALLLAGVEIEPVRNDMRYFNSLQLAAATEKIDIVRAFVSPKAKTITTNFISSEAKLVMYLIAAGIPVKNQDSLTRWLFIDSLKEGNLLATDFMYRICEVIENKLIPTLTDEEYKILQTELFKTSCLIPFDKIQTKFDLIKSNKIEEINGSFDLLLLLLSNQDLNKKFAERKEKIQILHDEKKVASSSFLLILRVLLQIENNLVKYFSNSLEYILESLNKISLTKLNNKQLKAFIIKLDELKELARLFLAGLAEGKKIQTDLYQMNEKLVKEQEDRQKIVADEEMRLRKKNASSKKKAQIVNDRLREKMEADRQKEKKEEEERLAKSRLEAELEARKKQAEADRMRVEQKTKPVKEKIKKQPAGGKKNQNKAMEEIRIQSNKAKITADRKHKKEDKPEEKPHEYKANTEDQNEESKLEEKLNIEEDQNKEARKKFFKKIADLIPESIPCYAVGGSVVAAISKNKPTNDYDLVAQFKESCVQELKEKDFVYNHKLKSIVLYEYRGKSTKDKIDLVRVHYNQQPWFEENAKTRDFTRNAVFCDIRTGELYDPTGRGIKDILSGTLSMIGDKEDFYADSIRVLRVAKFIYTGDHPDEPLKEAILGWKEEFVLSKDAEHFFKKLAEYASQYPNFITVLQQYNLLKKIEAAYYRNPHCAHLRPFFLPGNPPSFNLFQPKVKEFDARPYMSAVPQYE